MVTDLGLKLEYNQDYTNTQNLFLQLFGRLPKKDCDGRKKDILLAVVKSNDVNDKVGIFFGLCEQQVVDVDDTGDENGEISEERNDEDTVLKEVADSLQEIRDNCSKSILLLYDEYPEECLPDEMVDSFLGDMTKEVTVELCRKYLRRVMARDKKPLPQ